MRDAEKVYTGQDVYEAAIERIERLYSEFDDVVVGFSGGKDSTVILNLAIEVATKLDRLPVKTLFIDQEAEWETVIEYCRSVAARPEVDFMWFQIPLKIFNASSADKWFYCWQEGADWIRPHEPSAITVNDYGTDEALSKILVAIAKKDFKPNTCYIAGMRAEESPTRMMSLTHRLTYKDITWGTVIDKQSDKYTFYPIYDWRLSDVWKYISSNELAYCPLYDYLYQYGVPPKDMRISSITHEYGIKDTQRIHEIEADTWNKVVTRINGLSTAANGYNELYKVKELPAMFETWREYRDYLIASPLLDDNSRSYITKQVALFDAAFTPDSLIDSRACIATIRAILQKDDRNVIMGQFWRSPDVNNYRKYKKGKITKLQKNNIYLESEYGKRIYA